MDTLQDYLHGMLDSEWDGAPAVLSKREQLNRIVRVLEILFEDILPDIELTLNKLKSKPRQVNHGKIKRQFRRPIRRNHPKNGGEAVS